MIKPAIRYKTELERLFAEEIYTERYFYYVGYAYGFELPEIAAKENVYQWAILDDDKIIGYVAYCIDPSSETADRFGLYSFDEGNIKVIKAVYQILEDLCRRYHRVEWRVVSGNHAKRGYDRFCKAHGGYISHLHDVTKDTDGNYRDIYIYEIIKKEGEQ